MKQYNLLPIVAGILSAGIVGFSFLFLKNIVSETSPLAILSYRFTIAFIVMTAFILLKVIRVDFRHKPVLPLILFSIVQPVLSFSFQTYGMKYASSSEAGIITALVPIFVMLFAAILLKESTTTIQKASILLSVGGVSYITVMKGVDGEANMLGIILIFLSVVSMAFYTVLAKKFSKQFSPIELTYAMMGMGMIMFNLVLFVSPEKADFTVLLKTNFILPMLYLAILSSVVTSFLSNYMVSRMKASQSVVFMNLSTIVSILAGVFILHETFYTYHLIGTIMIIIGVVGANIKGINIPKQMTQKSTVIHD
ncbi:DMT family transporter [Cytobacillus sp. IB215316]|uniref:DMT family transporter n=1 Tax=Cytobacillus sp. IB215316 TaxID=3097354 RepID=UPI002A140E18|nr:DMT family transporter [Cytobacillus sp. IB215316]MDX8361207.1 DMT family transporter [Cytobacillus sp. IB215316]